MPYSVQLARAPAGFAATAGLPGERFLIEVCGFHTSDEGSAFTRLLEGCDEYLSGGPQIDRSAIDHFLVVIAPDLRTTVYVNELALTARAQAKASLPAGAPVTRDHIADMVELDIGVEVPPDSGIAYMFSWGWRRALFFDFQPLGPSPGRRGYSLPTVLAGCLNRLMFSERFSLDEAQWERLIDQRWFPFVGLKYATVAEMIRLCQEGWDLLRLEPRLFEECRELAPHFVVTCRTSDIFRPHADAIATAARHLLAGEWFSACSILYPKIEGILRTYFLAAGPPNSPKQDRLLAAALKGAMVGRHGHCLLLLDRFDQYLKKVIFVPFDQANPIGVSRHTIAHGVVDPAQCDEKSAVLAMLSLHHLFFSLGSPQVKP